ncbi:MAG: hypothetical protein ACI867_000803 [Glaciecola sp.]|jgi:hypothetical protein
MRSTRAAVATLAGLALLLPAAAPDEPLVPCEVEADVIDEGESASYDALAPVVMDPSAENPTGQSRGDIAVVAGSVGETAIKATITATMTWDVPGDYELLAFDSSGAEIGNSAAFNPTDGNVESVTLTVDPCEEVTLVIDNYLGTPGGPVVLDVNVEGKRPRVR